MKQLIFKIIAIIGFIVIIILAIVLPNNPFETIKSYTIITTDRPLFINIIILSSFIYILCLYYAYDKIFNKK